MYATESQNLDESCTDETTGENYRSCPRSPTCEGPAPARHGPLGARFRSSADASEKRRADFRERTGGISLGHGGEEIHRWFSLLVERPRWPWTQGNQPCSDRPDGQTRIRADLNRSDLGAYGSACYQAGKNCSQRFEPRHLYFRRVGVERNNDPSRACLLESQRPAGKNQVRQLEPGVSRFF